MTRFLDSLSEIVDAFDVAVLDQWGVMHDGSQPYPHSVEAMKMLAAAGKPIVVVSNSGKRAQLNLQRIERIGLPAETIHSVVTSGEALWEDLKDRRLPPQLSSLSRLFAICGKTGDAEDWLSGNTQIELASEIDSSVDAVMLMGIPDATAPSAFDHVFRLAIELDLPLLCSNPDKTSPRSNQLVISPGALADRFADFGGQVVWYGKPYPAIYDSVRRAFPKIAADRFVMVGDSLEHDVAGAQSVGFSSVLVRSGIHANDFAAAETADQLTAVCQSLAASAAVRQPDYSIKYLA